jgi:uncharacterized protein YjbI with pentapeptide repeats
MIFLRLFDTREIPDPPVPGTLYFGGTKHIYVGRSDRLEEYDNGELENALAAARSESESINEKAKKIGEKLRVEAEATMGGKLPEEMKSELEIAIAAIEGAIISNLNAVRTELENTISTLERETNGSYSNLSAAKKEMEANIVMAEATAKNDLFVAKCELSIAIASGNLIAKKAELEMKFEKVLENATLMEADMTAAALRNIGLGV